MLTTLRKSMPWLSLPLGGALLILAFIFLLTTPSPAPAKPPVQWTPSSINATILAGETKTVPVSFIATEDLTDVVVRVVPELEPYIQVDPIAIGSVSKGQIVDLDLVVSAPATSLPGSFDGTVQLRRGTGSGENFPKLLPTIVKLGWPRAEIRDGDAKFSFAYPARWNLSPNGSGFFAYNLESSNPGDEFLPPDLAIGIKENASNLSLANFIAALSEGKYMHNYDLTEMTIDGHEAILVSSLTRESPLAPALAIFIAVPSAVVVVSAPESSESEFFIVIESLSLL